MNPWFRMYAEFAFDPKVQVLTEALQRRYVMALCLHCDGKLENRPDDEISLALRITVEDWQKTKEEFIRRGLFSSSGIPSSWNKRQYISDIKDPTATERQKRYRDKKRIHRNAPVTSRLPDSDTDTETDKKKTSKGTRFALQDPPAHWIHFCQTERPDLDPQKTFDGFRDYWIARPGREGVKLDWDATWRNWVRNQKGGNNANTSRNHQQSNGKPTYKSEGQRLADKYREAAEREEQAAIGGTAEPNMRLAEGLREDPGGT